MMVQENKSTYSLGHANTRVSEGQGFVSLVWDDVDPEIFASVKFAWI